MITDIVQCLYAKKGSKPKLSSPLDFIIDWTGDKVYEPKTQSVEEMKQMLMSFAKSQNKRVAAQDKRTTPPVKKTNKK